MNLFSNPQYPYLKRWCKQIDFIAVVLVIGFAILLHIPPYRYTPFWVDELWRANFVLNPDAYKLYISEPSVYTGITSPIYLAMNKLLAEFSISPQVLRLSSLIPSVLTPGIAYIIIRKLNGDFFSALLAAILFVLNIELYIHSLQFKPYSLEILIHLICIYFWINLLTKKTIAGRDYLIFSIVLTISLLTAMNVVFILPAFGVTLFLNARLLNSKSNQFKTVLLFIGLLFFVLCLYWFIWRFANSHDMQNMWEEGFNQNQAYLFFAYEKLSEIYLGSITILGLAKDGPTYLKITQSGVIEITLILMLFLSIFFARKKQTKLNFLWLVFIGTFFATIFFLNYLHLWPIGQLRSNLFINAFIILWICIILSQIKIRNIPFLSILIITGAIFISLRTSINQLENTAINEQSDMVFRDFSAGGEIGNRIENECAQGIKAKIYMNSAYSHAFEYFNTYDPYAKHNWRFPKECVEIKVFTDNQFLIAKTILNPDLKKSDTVWLLYSHIPSNEITELMTLINQYGTIKVSKSYSNAGYLWVQKNN